MYKVQKGYLAGLFNTDITVSKDVTYVKDCHYRGLNINAGSVGRHGNLNQCGRPWLDQLLRMLQYAYLRNGSQWIAMHVKIHVLPREMQEHDIPLALAGKELLDLVLEEVKKHNQRLICNFRVFLEKKELNPFDEPVLEVDQDGNLKEENEGGYHQHCTLIATGIRSHAALEIAFRSVKKKHPKFQHACMEFVSPDIKRVADKELQAFFRSEGIIPNGHSKHLSLNSDAAYEYAFYWLSYCCKKYTKELLGKEGRGWKISRGNRMKDPRKGIHSKVKASANESLINLAA